MSQLITGLAFPIRFDALGRLTRASGQKKLFDNLRLIVLTAYNQRTMRPSFGTSADASLFKKIDYIDHVQLKQDILQAVERFERRVRIVEITISNTQDDTISIMIDYTVAGLGYQPVITDTFTL